jgi:hypothetical protein
VETFRQLYNEYGFAASGAFNIATRVHRGGGLTKDAIYIRGLSEILSLLGGGGELEPFWIGKIALHHVPVINELRWRGALTEPPLVPRYIDDDDYMARLDRVRSGIGIDELCSEVE